MNINARQDGAASYSGVNQSLWHQPFFTAGATQLLRHTVTPGTYRFRIINTAHAAQQFPALTPAQLSTMFTAWTYNSPYLTDYLVFDDAAASNASLYQLFDGAFSNTNGGQWFFYSTAANAYDGAVAGGFADLIRSGPLGRSSPNPTNSYTFTNTQTLIFTFPDYDLSDNSGGVSVLVSPVLITRPVLQISSAAGNVTLQWTTNATGFNLEQSAYLQPAAWTAVTNVPVVSDTNYSVTLPLGTTQKFFQLHRP